MTKEGFQLQELLNVEAPPERVNELMRWVKIDLPNLSDDVKRPLLKQQVEMFNIEYGCYMAVTKIIDELFDALMEDAIDIHVHEGSDFFERQQLEDEIAIDCTKAKMKAVAIKNWYTPSASRIIEFRINNGTNHVFLLYLSLLPPKGGRFGSAMQVLVASAMAYIGLSISAADRRWHSKKPVIAFPMQSPRETLRSLRCIGVPCEAGEVMKKGQDWELGDL